MPPGFPDNRLWISWYAAAGNHAKDEAARSIQFMTEHYFEKWNRTVRRPCRILRQMDRTVVTTEKERDEMNGVVDEIFDAVREAEPIAALGTICMRLGGAAGVPPHAMTLAEFREQAGGGRRVFISPTPTTVEMP